RITDRRTTERRPGGLRRPGPGGRRRHVRRDPADPTATIRRGRCNRVSNPRNHRASSPARHRTRGRRSQRRPALERPGMTRTAIINAGQEAGVGISGPAARSGLLPQPSRCAVLGVLNVTPDSFSDGGRYQDTDDALTHAHEMWWRGADLIDVGGESARPGAWRVDADTANDCVIPLVRSLVADGMRLAVDTSRARVAAAALEAGASVVNDVPGGLADPEMARVVADAGVPWVLMHWRGHSKHM